MKFRSTVQNINIFHMPQEVADYYGKYSLNGWTVELYSKRNINNIIVVPALEEYENIKRLLESLSGNDKTYFDTTAIIFVINNLSTASEEIRKNNYDALELLKNIVFGKKQDEFAARIIASGLRIGFIDAASIGKELPGKDGGVGLARKIGMDLSLTIFNYNSETKKLLICLDADCTVQQNYLTEIVKNFNERNLSAAVVKFIHHTDEQNMKAIICYEIFLHYYVLGLKFACSHYAFHTIGSTMVCTDKSYIKSEGMNKRKAAEDFYFMEKLAKNYAIDLIPTTAVFPSPRKSWRVPFGTGQRVGRFLSGTQNEYLLYDPVSFLLLKKWLQVFNSPDIMNAASFLEEAKNIHPGLSDFLIEHKFQYDWDRIFKDSKSEKQIQKQKQFWFDGFRTLKFIHYMRDKYLPMKNMFDAVDELFVLYNYEKPDRNEEIPPINQQMIYLANLRKLTFS